MRSCFQALFAAALFAGCCAGSLRALAQAGSDADYSEIPVSVSVQGVGQVEMPALIDEHRGEVFLPVADLFDFLKVKHTATPSLDTVQGSFGPALPFFLIDRVNAVVLDGTQVISLKPEDIVRTDVGLYLRGAAFSTAFGLECSFTFRSLSVVLTTRMELPAQREARLSEGRQAASSRSRSEVVADTVVRQRYPLFSFGAADWMVSALKQPTGADGARGTEVRAALTLGLTALGGETVVSLNWGQQDGLARQRQYYLWRRVNNHSRLVRQVAVGKIANPLIASVYSPLIGVQVTNTPTTPRKSFSTYKLSNTTRPFWTVELYVNNVLVDYKKSDSTGFYSFDVPLVYGMSDVKLRFYGPYGEESFKEEHIVVPFNLLPRGVFEYSASAGVVDDSTAARFARMGSIYGLSNGVTLGAGVEYLSSVTSGPTMPFANASVRITQRLLFNGEYTHGARLKGLLSYRFSTNGLLEAGYWKYEPGQTAIVGNYLGKRNVSLTLPIRGKKVSLFSRMVYNELLLPTLTVRTGEWMLSGNVYGVNANVSTFVSKAPESRSVANSNASLMFRLPKGFLVTPQVQYEYTSKQLVSAKCLVEKMVFRKGFLNAAYEKNFRSNIQSVSFGLRYDFSFAQMSYASVHSREEGASFLATARGGLAYDPRTRDFTLSNRTTVGRAGLVIAPFLDLNCNGARDEGEPRAAGFKFRGTGGRVEHDYRDTVIRIFDLEPYSAYILYPDATGFENIAWVVRQKAIAVEVTPNQLAQVDVPVAVVGEISGIVYNTDARGKRRGKGRITVQLLGEGGTLVAKTLSEADGYYSFMGLAPGAYRVVLEEAQLDRLGLKATPLSQDVRVRVKVDGDVVGKVDFGLE